MSHLQTLTLGLALASAIALLARRHGALTVSGAVAAAVIGALAMAAGWSWGILLIGYFASSTLLSRFRAAEKASRTEGRVEKGGPRDAMQVLANGGVYVLAAVGFWVRPDPLWQALGAGALAASAADTWATEVGTLAGRAPRSILGGSPVAVGTSGGVTPAGLLAGLAGAGFIATVAWLVRWPGVTSFAALIGGVSGCLLDSVLGASLQARRWCATCRTLTEARIHRCGASTEPSGGISWLDNDVVNAISTIGGALFGATAASYL